MSDKMSVKEYREIMKLDNPEVKRNKYGAVRKEYNGKTYHSTFEANFAAELDLKVKAGIVKQWSGQYRLPLVVNGQLITTYVPDFRVTYTDGSIQLIECKGMWTPEAKLKVKLAQALLPEIEPGVELVIIRNK